MTAIPETELWARALSGDGQAFSAATDRYRRELEVHAYRLLGSAEDAEDVVQETLLRAWRRRETFRGEATLRAWLYGIATNASLDLLRRRPHRLLPYAAGPPTGPDLIPPATGEASWLEPYPDSLLDEVVERETIELAFLVAIQQLPPRQRAVLILRDVVGWSARETAAMLGISVIAGNSALQRARETLRVHLPASREEWDRPRPAAPSEQEVLARYVEAWTRRDLGSLAELLKEDVRLAMPPLPAWVLGRDDVVRFFANYPWQRSTRRYLRVPTRANRQPAFAIFLQSGPRASPEPYALEVIRIEDGLIAGLDFFLQPELIERFAIDAPV